MNHSPLETPPQTSSNLLLKALMALAFAALAIDAACSIKKGAIDYVAFGLLFFSLVACVAGFHFLRKPFANAAGNVGNRSVLARRLERVVPGLQRFATVDSRLLILLLCVAFLRIMLALAQVRFTFAPVWVALFLGAAGVFWSLRSPAGWWLQLATFVAFGVWFITRQEPKNFDVFFFQRDSCAALLHGVNPYSITFRNIYSDNSTFYGPGMSVHGRLHFGYVYMPLTLLLTLPGYLLGDVRFANLIATVAAAIMVVGLRPKAEKALLGSIFLWSPAAFFVMYVGYTDVFCALALAFVFFCTRRHVSWLPVACGLFLASKQYAILALPLLWLLMPLIAADKERKSSTRSSENAVETGTANGENSWKLFWPFLVRTLAVSAVVTLPLALWNFSDFLYSSLLLQFKQPFRPESLSFMALVNNLGWGHLHWTLPFFLMLAALVFALRRAPRNEIGFLVSVAFLFLVFFAFNKQAFVNYYYFAMSALWCAVVAIFNGITNEKSAISTHD